MTVVIILGFFAGLGCIGVVKGLHPATPSLESISATMSKPPPAGVASTGGLNVSMAAGKTLVSWVDGTTVASHPTWLALFPSLAITGESPERLASKVLVLGGAGLLGPPILWVATQLAGFPVSPVVVILISAIAAPAAACVPVARMLSRARGSFVDLVVLSLAGGVGIEGALLAASRVSDDWAVTRMARALSMARDSGQSPWAGLGQLGAEIAVPELVELSTTLELAGTEGARIRQSLSSRAVSLRRHEQADAESAANTMTERLFLPGALLLFGFLLFIGYPAFSRIIGGF
jgi:tight adherence protein C